MTMVEFSDAVRKTFGAMLAPLGFETSEQGPALWRRFSDEVYHFVVPVLGLRGTMWWVYVYPSSPAIDPSFNATFPDSVAIPTDSFSYLSRGEIGPGQSKWHCKTQQGFARGFEMDVQPALANVAIPYLDRFSTVQDILPVIRHRSFMGLALFHVGRKAEAVELLRQEQIRIAKLDASDQSVARFQQRIAAIIGTPQR